MEKGLNPLDIDIQKNMVNVFRYFKCNDNISFNSTKLQKLFKDTWSIPDKSRFIESLILGIPTPPYYIASIGGFYQSPDDFFEILDGNKRINLLNEFLSDKFSLEGLDFLKILEGSKFSELHGRYKRRILDNDMCFYTLRTNTPEVIKINLLMRLNPKYLLC